MIMHHVSGNQKSKYSKTESSDSDSETESHLAEYFEQKAIRRKPKGTYPMS